MIKKIYIKNNMKYIVVKGNSHIKNKSREDFLCEIVKWKKIIHIWPCDAPFTVEKYKNNSLLYQKFDLIVDKQIWFDVDADSIDFLNKANFERSKIVYMNMNDQNLDTNIWFEADYIVMWEVIEHIMNLENALKFVSKFMSENTKLIITTPNASRLDVFFSNFLNRSNEHEDHKVWYQLVNLINLIESNWLSYCDYHVSWFTNQSFGWNNLHTSLIRKFFSLLNYMLINFFPLFWNTHILICKKV